MGLAIAKKASKHKPATRRAAKAKPRAAKRLPIQVLADGVGVSSRTIDKYIRRGCPATSVEAVQKWRDENIRAVADDADISEIGIELKRAEVAERRENARTRQLKNDMLEGKLIRKDEVELHMRTALGRFSNRLQSLGLRCANLCPAELKAPIKEAVEETVRIALKEICDDLGSYA